MQFKQSTLEHLSRMICGDSPYDSLFLYRSSPSLTKFFSNIDVPKIHRGETRRKWVEEVLSELNIQVDEAKRDDPNYIPEPLFKVFKELLDINYYDNDPEKWEKAIQKINVVLQSENLTVISKDRFQINLTVVGGNFVSTATSYYEAPKVISIAPEVFKIPDDTIVQDQIAIMMPFTSSFDSIAKIIKGVCESLHMNALRADDIWIESTIIQDIFNLIIQSNIVIVDLTDKNPNVLYEMGIAHTLGKNVIPISQRMDDVPFDVRSHRVLQYSREPEGIITLQTKLKERIETIINK